MPGNFKNRGVVTQTRGFRVTGSWQSVLVLPFMAGVTSYRTPCMSVSLL